MKRLIQIAPDTKILGTDSTNIYLQHIPTKVGFIQNTEEDKLLCFHPVQLKNTKQKSVYNWSNSDEIVECYDFLVNLSQENPSCGSGLREKYCLCKVCTAKKKRKKELTTCDEQRVIYLNIPYNEYNLNIIEISRDEMGWENYKPCIRFGEQDNQIVAYIHSSSFYNHPPYTYGGSTLSTNSFADMQDYQIVNYIATKLKTSFSQYKETTKGMQFKATNQNLIELKKISVKICDIVAIYATLEKVSKSLKLRYDMTHMKK